MRRAGRKQSANVPLFSLLAGITALGGLFSAAVADEPDRASAQCAALASQDFSRLLDAPTQIIHAAISNDSPASPNLCRVKGYVAPAVGFTLLLPSKPAWNKKFFQLGCGGFCGNSDNLLACTEVLRRGYACLVSDNGHKSTGTDAKWAFNNLPAQIDHAFRATHVTSLAGKAVVQSYYGHAPQKSYFMGASTGGRQALMEAQRFPWDFDGIIAGVPSVNVTKVYMHLLWAIRALVDDRGVPRLSSAELELVHHAVLAKCDLDDGLRDELISDPRACAFDPSQLTCTRGKRVDCLRSTQVDVIRKLYSGPVTSTGEPVYLSGALKGSERTWLDYFWGGGNGNPWTIFNFAGDAFRYTGFSPSPGPTWSPNDFDFDRDYKRLGESEALYAAINPDLRAFKQAGGKLIAYAGWADAIGMPLPMVDYYETVERVMGGRDATQEFFRLFVIPGMTHGPSGKRAFVVDWISHLESWVEHGAAPEAVESVQMKLSESGEPKERERLIYAVMSGVSDPSAVVSTRPVYPYPILAIYSGQGDPNDARSFKPANPAR